jgi:glutamate-ammonia-ligase adenylyltransferase
MAQGKLYEVDMRLRPSGNQGPVATSLASFENYQKTNAWVWEHLALTRANVVAGPDDLGRDVDALCAEILASPSDKDAVRRDVAEMRQRIATAKAPDGVWDAKIGAGRLQDIELFAQTGALIAGKSARHIPDGIAAAVAQGIITDKAGATLGAAYEMAWRLQCAGRLLSASALQTEAMGQAATSFLSRALGCDTLADAKTQMEQSNTAAAAIIDAALNNGDLA